MSTRDHSAATSAGADAGDATNAYRRIPAVNDVVAHPDLATWLDHLPRALVVEAVQAVLDEHRGALAGGNGAPTTPSASEFAARAASRLEERGRPPLASVINATGIIIHTGLGRAPLAAPAVAALCDVAAGYAPVELDLATGGRGRRATLVRPLLCELTGAESATVVNNNAAALVIILAALALDRDVVVSRGELIEIGGSFRLPEIMRASGARLHEVGTTNKTRLVDYERAIGDSTAALLKVHPSNYRVEGFTESVPIDALVRLGASRGVPVVHDIGSGALRDLERFGVLAEPDARASIAAGADLVLFSGDKLLGGPQAGIIVGRRAWIDRVEKNPLMRAMRVDKLVLAALAVTLQLHRDPDLAAREVPVMAMLITPLDVLSARGERLVARLRGVPGVGDAVLRPSMAYLGGGSLPTHGVESRAVEIRPAAGSEETLAHRLRTGRPAVIPRVQGGAVHLDLRTIAPHQDDALVEAVGRAI